MESPGTYVTERVLRGPVFFRTALLSSGASGEGTVAVGINVKRAQVSSISAKGCMFDDCVCGSSNPGAESRGCWAYETSLFCAPCRYLLAYFLFVVCIQFVLWLSCCFDSTVFLTTLVYEFHIFDSQSQ